MRMLVVIGLMAAAAGVACGQASPGGIVPEAAERFRKHGIKDAPAKDEGRLRLATYNVHELYDDADDPALSGDVDDLPRAMEPSRRAAVAAAIRRVDADVLALQEVESLAAVEWLRDSLLGEMGYTHAAGVDVGHPIGLEQAVLSRVPILDTRVWTDMEIGVHPPTYRGRPNRYAGQPMTFRRSPLMVELDVSGGEAASGGSAAGAVDEAGRLTLLVVHFKTGSGSEAWREAEAGAIVRIAESLREDRPDRRIVVLGDFVGGAGSAHVSRLVEAGFTDVFGGLDRPAEEIATDLDGGRENLILAGPGAAGLFEGGARFVIGTVAPPAQLDREIAYRMPGFASDHYPVAADMKIR